MLDAIIGFVTQFIEIVFHLDVHLNQMMLQFGPWMYLILFLIIFCETGLIILPFLPGDSLLFALGALTATEGAVLTLPMLAVILISAAIMGDTVNYSIGKYLGHKAFEDKSWINKKHLYRAQEFYEKHGGKTIVLARFIPIIRTFAPFVAGVGRMNYSKFILYNVAGGVVWVLSFLIAGNYFGNLPVVKTNFHIVIVGIIVVSALPVLVEYMRARRNSRHA